MSSLSKKNSKGLRPIQLICADGVRRKIYLPKGTAKKDAETFNSMVNRLRQCQRLGEAPEEKVTSWLLKLDNKLREKLVKLQLVDATESKVKNRTLGGWCDFYIQADNVPAKEDRRKLTNAKNKLISFFGAEKQMHTITKGDVLRFVLKLSQSIEEGGFGLARNTTAPRTIGYCRQIFSRAIDDQIITTNPFKQKSVTATVGRGAGVYVQRDVRKRIYDVLPNNIWRLRHLLICENGLACPSELNHLKWSDIDWENQTMLIHKQKTKTNRKAFIMPAVMPILEAVYDAAPEGEVYVVPTLTNTHMARMYHKFQIQADVNDWNCLFISLRKSAVQDAHAWAQQIGLEAHVIDLWFGHTKAVSDKFYKAANETHYAKAKSAGSKVSHFSDTVSHKVSQQAQESISTQPQAYTSDTTENGTNEQESELLRNTKKYAVGDTGPAPM